MTKAAPPYQRASIRPRAYGPVWHRLWHPCTMVGLLCVILFALDGVTGDNTPCPVQETEDISAGTLLDDGSIEHRGVRYGARQRFYNGSTTLGCVCLVRQCIHICCPGGTSPPDTFCPMDSLNVNFSTPLENGLEAFHMVNLIEETHYHYLYSMPRCSQLLALYEDEFTIRSDGRLAYGPSLFLYREYCLQPNGDVVTAGYCETVDIQAHHRWYSYGIILSLPFLVATFVVYALLPEMQNIPGKSLMCYVAALTLAYLLVALMRLSIYGYQSVWCRTTGYIVYFALLASFFWMNVMAFDIFWTFGGSRGRISERRKFLYYSLYAWGFPLALVALVLLFDHTDFMHHSIRPAFGQSRCFLQEGALVGFVYMYLPMVVLVGANVTFFAVTALRIFRAEKATASALSGDSRRHIKYEKETIRFGLYLRLFIIMGVTWTVEIATWLFGEPNVLVYLLDICNWLTGVFIFILFVCKPRVRELLRIRCGCQRTVPVHDPNTNSTISAMRSAESKLNVDHDVPLTSMTHVN